MLAKDTRLAVDAADAVDFNPALGRMAQQVFAQALAKGWADLDDAVLLQFMRQA